MRDEQGMECDWCARAGEPRDYLFDDQDTGDFFENPILCDVCWSFYAVPAKARDILDEQPGHESAVSRFEAVLAERWRSRSESRDGRDE